MIKSIKIGLAALGVLVLLLVAGNVWFVSIDERRAEAFRFAMFDPADALKEITQKAEAGKGLAGSGKGVVIPERKSDSLGLVQWNISADGVVQGNASKRDLTVVWKPELKDGKVEWRCVVEPKREFSPGACAGAARFER